MKGKFGRKLRFNKQLALQHKKANQKDKAMRLLTEIKQLKAGVTKITGYNTVMMKQLGNIESVKIDADVADIFADTVI